MTGLLRGLKTSVGTKYVMALTGVALLLFVLAHMLGNLQIFRGQQVFNDYAAGMQSLGPILWIMRLGLLGIFVAHVASAVRLTLRNRAARPVRYAGQVPLASTYASRTMLMSGIIVTLFVVFHLLHLTVGVTHPEHHALRDAAGRPDVYSAFILGFRQAPVTLAYVLAMVALGMHLSHGVSSLFQSLGWNAPRYRGLTRLAGQGIAALIVLGNILMPLACLFGWISLPDGLALSGGR